VTERGARYHPFAFGWRAGVAVACGAVASYLSGKVAVPVFPAVSTHVPVTAAEEASGPP
jgi:hypothetical protein